MSLRCCFWDVVGDYSRELPSVVIVDEEDHESLGRPTNANNANANRTARRARGEGGRPEAARQNPTPTAGSA
jgi:hypothetical protein